MSRSPIGIAAQRAVCSPTCSLPPELRLYLVTLAVLADRRTGRGTSGQDRIAACMGVTRRTVQRLGAELASRTDSPVIVQRRARMKRGGRGRNSDEYQLTVKDQGDTGVTLDSTDQSDTGDREVNMPDTTTKATATDDQSDKPGRTKATPASPNPGSDPGSDPSRSIPSRRCAPGPGPALVLEAPKAKKSPKQPKPKRTRTDAEVASHREILDAYSAAVLARTGAAPTIGSREAGAGWRLLDWCKGDGARAVITVRGAVARDFGGTTSLVVIASDPNKYLGGAKSITRAAGAGPKQPNAGQYRPEHGDF